MHEEATNVLCFSDDELRIMCTALCASLGSFRSQTPVNNIPEEHTELIEDIGQRLIQEIHDVNEGTARRHFRNAMAEGAV